jgi:nicotinamidase-related amidase
VPDLLVGQPVVLSIDVQQDGAAVDGPIPHMPGFEQRLERSVAIVEAAHDAGVPYQVPKRRYSAFFGTDLDILLRGLGARTLVLLGSLTDVCVHSTFADAHQHDCVVRVTADAVGGSSLPAHEASPLAMEHLQTGAVRLTREIVAALRAHSGPRRPGVRPRLVVDAM